MKNLLIIVPILVAVAMIYLGIKGNIIPPTLTGIGFFIVAALFYVKNIILCVNNPHFTQPQNETIAMINFLL